MFLSFQMYSRFQTQWSRFRMDHLKSRSGFVWKCWVPQNAVVSHPFPTENLGQQQTAGCNSWAGPFSQKNKLPTVIVCLISQHVIPFCLSRFSLYICSIVFPCSSTWVSLSFLGLPQLFLDAYLIWISLNWLCPNIGRVSQCLAIQHNLAGENVGKLYPDIPSYTYYHLLDAHYYKCNWVYLMISMDDIHGWWYLKYLSFNIHAVPTTTLAQQSPAPRRTCAVGSSCHRLPTGFHGDLVDDSCRKSYGNAMEILWIRTSYPKKNQKWLIHVHFYGIHSTKKDSKRRWFWYASIKFIPP